MLSVCSSHGLKILSFGTLAAGFLSNIWLGAEEPDSVTLNRGKYIHYALISHIGGWAYFQHLLQILDKIAMKHQVDIAAVASRFILQQKAVSSVVIGARLGITKYIDSNLRILSFSLDHDDFNEINSFISKGRKLEVTLAEIGSEYRKAKITPIAPLKISN